MALAETMDIGRRGRESRRVRSGSEGRLPPATRVPV